MDLATVDHLLTTTRSVRKRLDFTKPVDWPWSSAASRSPCRRRPARTRRAGTSWSSPTPPSATGSPTSTARRSSSTRTTPTMRPQFGETIRACSRRRASSTRRCYLAEHLHEVPVHVIPCVEGRVENAGALAQASVYGSILPGGVVVHAGAAAARARARRGPRCTHVRAGRREAPRHPGARHADGAASRWRTSPAPTSSPPSACPSAQLVHWNAWGRTAPERERPLRAARRLIRTSRWSPSTARSRRTRSTRRRCASSPPPGAASPPMPEIRCAVLTGAGERVFCAGMDMKTTIPAAQRFARGERVDRRDLRRACAASRPRCSPASTSATPLVCAVNGHARAGGFDLMLASEIRYAVPHATFALEEVALGLYPTGNATVLLPRQIAWVHAHELLLTARPIDAAARARDRAREPASSRRDQLMATALDDRRRDRRQRAARRARDAARRARDRCTCRSPTPTAARRRSARRSAAPTTRARRSAPSSRSAARRWTGR